MLCLLQQRLFISTHCRYGEVDELFDWIVGEKHSLTLLLGEDQEAFVHAVEQLHILVVLGLHLLMQLEDV